MGLNITHTMNTSQFESRENLKNAARDILNRQNASQEAAQRVMDKTIFNNATQLSNVYAPQLAIIKASAQISANGTLKETLKYLKEKANHKTQKTPVLGELWNLVDNEEEYKGELVDFVIDENIKNIFIAA